ncbi:MAG: DUF2207 domain-containing protein [Candidatus Doudnabacteria bacterium]|nr:DUF2207 domain-containing protein [Candidatus Doudnabacteria bacterium]
MKKLVTIIFLGLILAQTSAAQTGTEQIQSFDAVYTINPDSSLDVAETIVYDFRSTSHHGIFRDIPYKYTRNGVNYNLRVSNVLVNDSSGTGLSFTTSKKSGLLDIKIGDPDVLVSGVKTYVVHYHVERAINYFDDHDELYWNATGNDWQVPIGGATATVILPGTNRNFTNTACFAGPPGSTASCSNGTINDRGAQFTQGPLAPGEGLTFVVSIPKGLVHQPSTFTKFLDIIRDNLVFLLPIFALLGMWYLWNKYGRDPKPSIPRVAQYEAPDNLTPAEAGFLAAERTSNSLITAEIIYLATKGYLKIERIPKQGIFGSEDYKFTRLKEAGDSLGDLDKKIMSALFNLGPSEVMLSSLKGKGKATSNTFGLNSVPKRMTTLGYFIQEPHVARMKYIGSAAILLGIMVYFFTGFLSIPVLFAIAASLIIVILFGYFMPKKTQKGADTQAVVLGLRDYMSVAEKDRLDFHNDPAKDPQIFEKLLPYAIALGVSSAWAQKFEGLFQYQPRWFYDPTHTYFNFVVFNDSISHFNKGFAGVLVANAASAAGGGRSGFGGGGFSGGGFGGGGGGSW